MIDLIQELIYKMKPAYKKLKIVAADGTLQNTEGTTNSMERVVESRVHGDRRAVVIYGYDHLDIVKQRQYGSLLSEDGIFYLQLPARLEQVYPMLDTALNYKDGKQGKSILQGAEYIYALQKIGAFKHRCDNLWMSMQSKLSIQKAASKKTEPVAVKRLINRPYIERFSKEYETEIEKIVMQIGLKRAKEIPMLFSNVIKSANKFVIEAESPVTKETLKELSGCVKKIQAISEILSTAKETEDRV